MTAVRFLDRNKLVLYASENEVPMNANLGDPTVGTDGSAALQSLLNRAGANGGTVVIDGPVKAGNLQVPSGVSVVGLGSASIASYLPGFFPPVGFTIPFPSVGVIQAPATRCVFRNVNLTSNWNNGTPIADYSTVVDHDITIRNLFINGNGGGNAGGVNNANGGGYNRFQITGPTEFPIVPLKFLGVRNITVEDVFIYDPAYFHTWFAYIDGGTFRRLRFCDPLVYSTSGGSGHVSTDGLHITGPARNIVASDLTGYTGDDFVSIAANDGNFSVSNVNYDVLYFGDITDVVVEKVDCKLSRFKIISCYSGSAIGNSLIDRLTIRDVKGYAPSTQGGAVGLVRIPNAQANGGNFGAIGIFNVNAFTNTSSPLVSTTAPIRQLVINGLFASSATAVQPARAFTLNNSLGGTYQSIQLSNINLANGLANSVLDAVSLAGTAVTINHLSLNGVVWAPAVANTTQLVAVNNGVHVKYLHLTDVCVDNVRRVVNVPAGGLVDNLVTSNLTHTNAGVSQASIQVAGTVSRLRCSGSDTVLLSSVSGAGVITSKKTDATEDA